MEEDDGEPSPAATPLGSVAWRLFALLVRRSRGPTELVEDLLGRAVSSRVLAEGELARIAPPGLSRLDTTGPVLRRHVVLTDSLPPHLPVAVTWSVVVSERLPSGLAAEMQAGDEPLDRLLDRWGLGWSSRPVEIDALPAREASVVFPWAPTGSHLIEQARVVHVGAAPVAATIDELPFLAPRDFDAPLRPVTS